MISDVITTVFSAMSFDGLVALFQEHQLFISVLLPFFAGELSIHLFGILNGSGDISLVPVMIAVTSVLFFDVLIYGTVRALQRYDRLMDRFRAIPFFARLEQFFKKHEERYSTNQLLLHIAVKLMPLTKVTLIFFALYQKMSMLRFIIQDALITVVWVTIIFFPGWLVGKEFLTEEAGRRLGVFIIYFILLIVLMLLFGGKIDNLIMRVVTKISEKMRRE